MITLLSPAKKLDFETPGQGLPPTEPRLLDETKILAKRAKSLTAQDLQDLMGISENLATLNADRFASFVTGSGSNQARSAALAFDGDVYSGLDARDWSEADMNYAQDHVRILSGLYGLLRPLDAIQPYRLEMGTKLDNPRGDDLYSFWGTDLAELIKDDMQDHDHQTVVNLASNEYFKAVKKKALSALDVPVIDAKFLNVKEGKARNLMFYGKRARGLMAKWIVQNRIDNPADLKAFDLEDYQFDAQASKEGLLIFTRPQPPTQS